MWWILLAVMLVLVVVGLLLWLDWKFPVASRFGGVHETVRETRSKRYLTGDSDV